MSEGGEARNHETDEAAVALGDVIYAETGHVIDTATLRKAVDAVRRAQGRDTDAPEVDRCAAGHCASQPMCCEDECKRAARSLQGEVPCPRCSGQGVEEVPAHGSWEEHGTVYAECRKCGGTVVLTGQGHVAECRDCDGSGRSPQGEDHEAGVSHWECECGQRVEWKLGAWFCPTHRDKAVVHPVAASSPERNTEIDRLRAGISFVRGLCTDWVPYSVIDERLGELLDGETK